MSFIKFSDFIAENRLHYLGIYLLATVANIEADLKTPYPNELDDSQLESLLAELESAMPTNNVIADIKDMDVQLLDVMGNDWFFSAIFGGESSIDDYADELAVEFIQLADQLKLDYNQMSDPEGFAELIRDEANLFIREWRKTLYKKHATTN